MYRYISVKIYQTKYKIKYFYKARIKFQIISHGRNNY